MESTSSETGKLRQPITAKRWVLSFVGAMAFIMLMIAVVNYIVDPFSYFHTPITEDRLTYSYDGSYNLRLAHYNYFKEYHQEYSGVIVGGSKGMFIEEAYLSMVSGEKYCQLAAEHGNFHDYLDWVRWIADNTSIRHIFLNLSIMEVAWYTPKDRDEETSGHIELAALDKDKSAAVEFVQYLYRGGIEPSLQYLKAKKNGTLIGCNIGSATSVPRRRNSDPWSHYGNWVPNVNYRLEQSANEIYEPMPAIERNLAALKEICEICAESNIQLKVVIAPTSTTQYLAYESPEYLEYLIEMAQITDDWDFSMPNAINKNMFNYVNEGHMCSKALRHMLDQICGVEPDDGSGVYVTADNIEEYIAERQRRYNELMAEYAETGTVKQGLFFDDGYIMNELFDPFITNTENTEAATVAPKNYLNVTQHFYASCDYLEGIGIFAEGVPSDLDKLGNLKLQVYDDTGKHTLFSGDVDLDGIQNKRVYFIHLGGLELVEGHWYSLIFSYEPKEDDDLFRFQCVDGEPTGNVYMELDNIPQVHEMKMDLFRRQTYGNFLQRYAMLQTDRMRGEGENETLELTEQTRYTQFFTTDCDLISCIQLKTSHKNDLAGAIDDTYNIILELRNSDGVLMSRKNIIGAVVQNADVYNVTFDENLYVKPGEIYELTIYANKTTDQGLKLQTHGEESGSVLYLNGAKTGESLCYRIYGVDED